MSATLKIDMLTLFPELIKGFIAHSIIGRAIKRGILDIEIHNIRDWAKGKHQITDDRPFGGGAGMVLKPEPIFEAIEMLREHQSKVIYLAPDGKQLNSEVAQQISKSCHLILISGHYEGIDQRVRDVLVDLEISIGDYILTNGTLASAVLIDTVSRYIPGVLGEEKSLTQDSFNDSLLSFPQYTRPAVFRKLTVPSVLLSGDHNAIERWRKEYQKEKTQQQRPDLTSLKK